MAFGSEFDEALGEIILDDSLFTQSITWGGTDYRCSATGKGKGGTLEGAGWGVNDDLTVIIQLSQLGAGVPNPEETITYAGRTYRINRVEPNDAFIRLICMNASRGA